MPLKGALVTGTLDLLVLKALQLGEAHGWGIMDRIRTTSGDQLLVNQRSLYPSLYRLKRQGLIVNARCRLLRFLVGDARSEAAVRGG